MLENIAHNLFKSQGYLHVKELVDVDLSKFFTHVLMRQQVVEEPHQDNQVPDCLSTMDHEVMFETLAEKLWPALEQVTGLSLLPTYAYARLYGNGNSLAIHRDREECEVSVTIQLGRSHHYAWPIWVSGNRFDLGEGDGIIYKGCELDHWRTKCEGPNGYYSGQVFLHYVNADGPYANKAGDISTRKVQNGLFIKNRNWALDNK